MNVDLASHPTAPKRLSLPAWWRLLRSLPATLTLLLVCLALLWVSPFLWMLSSAFSASTFGEGMASLLPRWPLTLDNFRDAWQSADWLSLYGNTLLFAGGTFLVQLLTITTAGYVFACHEFRGQRTLFVLFLVQLMIMPVMMMVPNMLTLNTFGLLNTLLGVMMPYFTSAFGVFLMHQAFMSIPKEMEDAALMEGCRWWQVLFNVLLPMSWSTVLAFATVSITYHCNEYLWPLMMLNDPDKQVLTVGLVSFAMGAESGGQWGMISAGTLMVCLPLMLAFIVFQKQFLKSFGFSGIK
ncbi:N-Acetyl-D-glucosamine ABC transport system permease protein 2 [Candidatus Sodalis pierantonius str. SOPE]|uniref:N-Acetyl-D-glucosamine ABC transport system permease protein 2 n=1 Tax=Candidatus Sodalis pierantonii str. SOPE TaxID=2342 RepID=W0HIQ4_9GAMM|nr:carbohydrate ABC transporter permease [Candidatus Sodalis pierantonius]AHF73681.1 N-Acetyl-D-glucosamine ABC transport system permease protein 2 [Candidatus Sodalis pierantonius str. SOPE]